jgi:hypothetical protein
MHLSDLQMISQLLLEFGDLSVPIMESPFELIFSFLLLNQINKIIIINFVFLILNTIVRNSYKCG